MNNSILHRYTRVIIFLVTFNAASFSFAQKGYVRFGGGYGIGINKAPMNSYIQNDVFLLFGKGIFLENAMIDISEDAQKNVRAERTHGSYGQGGAANFAAGYMLDENFGFELGFSYFFGQKVKSSWKVPSQSFMLRQESKFSSLLFTPSLIVTADFERLNPYARVGVVMALTPQIASQAVFEDPVGSFFYKDELKKGISVGFSGTVGVLYPLSKHMGIFGELIYTSMKYTPSEREIKALNKDGVPLPFSKKQALKKEAFLIAPPSFLSPELMAYAHPLSSLGINVGLQFNLEEANLARSR